MRIPSSFLDFFAICLRLPVCGIDSCTKFVNFLVAERNTCLLGDLAQVSSVVLNCLLPESQSRENRGVFACIDTDLQSLLCHWCTSMFGICSDDQNNVQAGISFRPLVPEGFVRCP